MTALARRAGVVAVLVIGTLARPGAGALTDCKVRVSSKTGTIDVFASNVAGPLAWGSRPGTEANAFANAAACISGTSAKKCELGAPGSLQAITPPDLCTLYLKDAAAECAVYIKGCTPGPRFTDQAKADALQQLVAAVSFHHSVPTIEFSGVNVQIDSGSGSTDGPVNGSGNLIVGYNEGSCVFLIGSFHPPCAGDSDCAANTCLGGACIGSHGACTTDADCPPNSCDRSTGRSGSHNVIIGESNSFTSYGGLVVGDANTIGGPFASVTAGSDNAASGAFASVAGGQFNAASGFAASVSGGAGNTASAANASVSGGNDNIASGFWASVTGGVHNAASEDYASVTGGSDNTANGASASVSGGRGNVANDRYASVSGGACNRAGPGPALSCGPTPETGTAAAVSGGFSNVASGDASSVSGGVSNTASGLVASVTGGGTNSVSGTAASVSGGALLAAGTTFEWHSGKSSGFPTGTQY